MADPIPVVAFRPPRPASVTAAGVSLFAAAAALLAIAMAEYAAIRPTGQAMQQVSDGLIDAMAFTGTLFGGAAMLCVMFALGLALLAAFDLAGKRPARIMTWIVAPLSVLCCGCGSSLYTEQLFRSAEAATYENLTQAEMIAIANGLPWWHAGTIITATVVLAVAVIAAVITLAVPSANDYFRKPPAGWIPGWAGYPGGGPPSAAGPYGYPAAGPYGYPAAGPYGYAVPPPPYGYPAAPPPSAYPTPPAGCAPSTAAQPPSDAPSTAAQPPNDAPRPAEPSDESRPNPA